MFAYGIGLLFFLQLLTSFVAANYAFGLLHNRLPPEAASAVLLLSPLLLVATPLRTARAIPALVAFVAAARLSFPLIEDTRAVMLVAGAGVAAFLLLLPLLISRTRREESAFRAGAGLAMAVAASVALRSLGAGVDVSTSGWTQAIAWPLALIFVRGFMVVTDAPTGGTAQRQTGMVSMLCLGIASVLALVYFGLGAPNVIAGWTRAGYATVTVMLMAGLLGWLAGLRFGPVREWLTSWRLTAVTALFGLLLVFAVLAHQVSFPSGAGEYPLAEPDPPGWAFPALVVTLLLSPIVVVDFWAIASRLRAIQPSLGELGIGFAVGGLFLIAVILAQIFTITYDYVPVVGPAFRDKFWLVVAAPALVLTLATAVRRAPAGMRGAPGLSLATPVAGMAVVAVAAAFLVQADPGAAPHDGVLRVVTYNVQQGYSADNRRSFREQLDLLRSFDADIIGLQESETNRVSGGNDDLVRYLADGLDYHWYSGPKSVTGTFGVALLSRYPIEDPETFFLFSEGEQKGTIRAKVTVGGRRLDVIVVHLGNGGPLEQQVEVLSLIEADSDVILLGDFNFRPDTGQYRITVERLDEAWLKRWPAGMDASGADHSRRIDYVFVRPGTDVRDAAYVDSPASNHPALVVTIVW
jgi:endonuclease/exonuclease/phosphatase family metal-dependent hydrolase